MATYMKNNVLFLFLWNILIFNVVHGTPTNRIQDQSVPANYLKDDESNNLNVAQGIQDQSVSANYLKDDELKNINVVQDGSLQDSKNSNVINPNERKDDSQNPNADDILNQIIKLLGLSQNSSNNSTAQTESTDNPQNENSFGITIVPVSQDNASQNNSPVDNTSTVVSSQPEETAPTSTAVQVYTAPTSTQSQNSADSDGITVLPITQNGSSENIITSDETLQSVLSESTTEVTQTQNVAPTESNSVPNQQQIDENNPTAGNDPANQGCGVQIADSPSKLQLQQVTVSQILYHLKMQYDQLDSKQGDNGQTYEITQTQESFLKEMLLSEKTASENNKNIVSTTYAAYYSAEYTYTFALCKLHHITKSFDDQQNPKHADISSKCSQIMETFSSFNMSYKETISEVMKNGGGQVLKYDNNDADKTAITLGENSDNSSTNLPTKKISTTNDETIQKQNLEKDLHGFNDNNFYNRVRSEDEKWDQFDVKQNQQIGDSTYSNETKGKKSDSATYLLSEVREIPKDKPIDDSSNGAKRLTKMSNTLRISSEAETRGRMQNADSETDSDRVQQYDRAEKELDQFARNYFDDDNNAIGGNIENAKLQDVQTHYSAVTEHIRDVNEQVTKPKIHGKDTTSKIYVFKQAVEKLMTYIQILNVFIENMDKTVEKKKTDGSNKGQDAYKEIHEGIYNETFIYRQYLKEYFASTNVESGTFSDKNNVVAGDEETEILQMTKVTEERLSWLKNTDMQGQANAQSTAEDEMKSDPITLLWYFEEASFYSEHFQQPENNVAFMSYLPYPNFDVKATTNVQDGADIQFYLN